MALRPDVFQHSDGKAHNSLARFQEAATTGMIDSRDHFDPDFLDFIDFLERPRKDHPRLINLAVVLEGHIDYEVR